MIGLGLKLTAQQQADNNLIFNGDFDEGLLGWYTAASSGGSASAIQYDAIEGALFVEDEGVGGRYFFSPTLINVPLRLPVGNFNLQFDMNIQWEGTDTYAFTVNTVTSRPFTGASTKYSKTLSDTDSGHYSVNFTNTTEDTYLMMYIEGFGAEGDITYFDNFVLIEN